MQVKAPPPRKLRLYILDEDSGRPARSVRVEAEAETLLPPPISYDSPAPPSVVQKLGVLSTDHVGFVAFAVPVTKSEVAWSHLWVYPSARPEARFDVLPLFRQSAEDVGITVRWKDARTWSENRPSLPSTHEIVGADWAASPKSFAVSNVEVVGENGCESLLISHAPQHVFLFHQIRRTAGDPTQVNRAPPYPCAPKPPTEEEDVLRVDHTCVRTGLIVEYELAWIPLGHGLGEVIYSLPLAPCESVKLAIIDWSRADSAVRGEETTAAEQLAHEQRRDRVIDEAVRGAIKEWQGGGAVLGASPVHIRRATSRCRAHSAQDIRRAPAIDKPRPTRSSS